MIDVTVIIVSWNAKTHLANCLTSIHRSRSQLKLEIIVVDNGSSDQSAEMVEEYFEEVRVVRAEDNLGFARANNVGIDLARGRYICLMNSDVEIFDETLDQLVSALDRDKRIGMIGPLVVGADGEIQSTARCHPRLWNQFCRCFALDSAFPRSLVMNEYLRPEVLRNGDRDVEVLVGCFWLVRSEALRSVRGLDEGFFIYAEDLDWCRRFRDAGWRIVWHPTSRAVHYGGRSSANAPLRFAVEMQKADLRYWLKHHSRSAVIVYFFLASVHHIFRCAGYAMMAAVDTQRAAQHLFKRKRSRSCLGWLWSQGRRMLVQKRPVLQIQTDRLTAKARPERAHTGSDEASLAR